MLHRKGKLICRRRILEMALEKSKYQDRVFSLMPQIVQNWCLCEYCRTYDPDNMNYRGWRKELIAHLGNLNSIIVRGDKQKWTHDEVIKDDEFNNLEVIKRVCEYKLDEEDDIDFTQEIRDTLYKSFSDNAEFIVNLISGKESVSQKIIGLFPISTDK